MDTNKLENIISGYRINEDDATWIRATISSLRDERDRVVDLLERERRDIVAGLHGDDVASWRGYKAGDLKRLIAKANGRDGSLSWEVELGGAWWPYEFNQAKIHESLDFPVRAVRVISSTTEGFDA